MRSFLQSLLVVTDSPHDFTARQVALLFVCHENVMAESRQVHRLAAEMGMSRPVIVRAADRLEEAGFLERSTLPGDRRTCVLSVTRAGERFVADVLGLPMPVAGAKPRRRRTDALATA